MAIPSYITNDPDAGPTIWIVGEGGGFVFSGGTQRPPTYVPPAVVGGGIGTGTNALLILGALVLVVVLVFR